MLKDLEYKKKWNKKLKWYKKNGILPYKNGKDEREVLIISER